MADTFDWTRSERLVERAHEVHVYVDHDHARLRVRRQVYNGADLSDQAVFWIETPQAAVATGLKTMAMSKGRPRWFRGELLEAELAAARYRELTGIGGNDPKDPALLSWRSQAELVLQVFPVLGQQDKWVEYTLLMPVNYDEGVYAIELPELGTQALPAELHVHAVHDGDRVFVNGWEPKHESVPASGGTAIQLERARAPLLDTELAVVPFADGRVLTRMTIDAAAKISEIPDDAAVLVLVDASASMDEELSDAQLAIARGYLSWWPKAQVDVLTFDFEVRSRFGRWVSSAEALVDLGEFVPHRRNGSALDLALAAAHRRFSKLPSRTARRIVVVSDLELRTRLTPPALAKIARATGATVHFVTVDSGDPELDRVDDQRWSAVPRGTGGLMWAASGSSHQPPEQMRAVCEELARPLQIHKFAIESGVAAIDDEFPDDFAEGTRLHEFLIAELPIREVGLSGELWSKPVRLRVRPNRAAGQRAAALVFGSDLLDELTEPEMLTLARHGGAVSPVTSYLAIEPGVRPSTEGLGDNEGGSIGLGTTGLIGKGGKGCGGGTGRHHSQSQFDPQRHLHHALTRAFLACGGHRRSLSLVLETTRGEIVDIKRVQVDGGDEAALRQCIIDAAWQLDLPHAFERWSRANWPIEVTG